MIVVWSEDFFMQSGGAPFWWDGGDGGGIAPIPGPDGFWIIRTRRRRG